MRDRHPFPDALDLVDDIRRLFKDLECAHHRPCASIAGECAPDLDLYEAPESFEICLDVPGVTAASVRVLLKAGVLVIAGEKAPPEPAAPRGATFHLAERAYGRFIRAVRLPGALDGGHATARLAMGELRISVPRIPDRRGKDLGISIHVE